MFKLNAKEMKSIDKVLCSMTHIDAQKLAGFACSASDNSCGCGWDCSSSKT